MASVLAIVSKAQFEELSKKKGGAKVGTVLGLERYDSTHRALSPLEGGGDLFLVTVRPDDVLWLVGVLASPKLATDHWQASASKVPITDATGIKAKLKFENGKGVPTEPGKLAMSLQTPRALSDADVKLLRGLLSGDVVAEAPPAPKPEPEKPKPAPKKPEAKKPAKPAPAPASVDVPKGWVADADKALRAGDAKKALTILLKAWRDLRHPVIAETVERVSDFVTKEAEPITGKLLKDKVAMWNARATAADPADFGVLAGSLFLVNSGKDVGEHLEQLAKWPADPRLSALCHELALKIPFTSTSARPFWRALFPVLSGVGDPRTKGLLDAMDAGFAKGFEGREDYLSYLPNQTKKVRAALANTSEVALDEPTLKALEAMRGFVAHKAAPTHGAEQIDSLLQAVYDDPTSDDPRDVLADALLEANDPRGEFLVLQLGAARGRALSRDEKRRERELLEEHAEAWLGPLAGWSRKGDRVFRRGFLAECHIEQKGKHAGPFPEIPAWATVESAVAQALPPGALRWFSAIQSLHSVAMECLLPTDRRWERLSDLQAFGAYEKGLFERFGDLAAFPALKKLELQYGGRRDDDTRPDADAVLGLFQRVERLEALRTELTFARTDHNYYYDGPVITLRREGGINSLEVRLYGDAGNMLENLLDSVQRLAQKARFVERTKVLAWTYSGYQRSLGDLKKCLPETRLEALGLRGLEVEYVLHDTSEGWGDL